jgi:dienelactone hydrolase
MRLFIIIFIIIYGHIASAGADALKVSGVKLIDKGAVCNSGSNASYYTSDDVLRNKIFIFLEGGDVARSEANFLQRSTSLTTSLLIDKNKKTLNLKGGFKQIWDAGYSIVYVPYCSSDIFMGDHFHEIGDRIVPFKGRKIIESIANQLEGQLSKAHEIVLAGVSAGSIGITANLDIFVGKFENTQIRVLLDSFWLDTQERLAREKLGVIPFIHKSVPETCEDVLNCYPQISRLDKFGVSDAFIILNMGDNYRFGLDDDASQAELKDTFERYGGGISVGRGFGVKGRVGEHGILGADAFNQKIDGIELGQIILNWLQNSGTKSLVLQGREKPTDGIAQRVSVIKNPSAGKATIVISGDGDCDGHPELQRKLEEWDYNWIYIDHCLGRTRKGGTNRITWQGVTPEQTIQDIMKTVEWIDQQPFSNKQIVVIGFAQSGSAVNALVDQSSLERAAGIHSFSIDYIRNVKGAVSYYPMCALQRISPRPAIPHLVQIAKLDKFDNKGFVGCGEAKSRSSGYLTIEVYPNAEHGFDRSKYSGDGKLQGRDKVGDKWLIEYNSEASKNSLNKLKQFLLDSLIH